MAERLLARQLRRAFTLENKFELPDLLQHLRLRFAANDPHLAGQFDQFVRLILESYQQFNRDLELRTRGLELSSAELLTANRQLQDEVQTQRKAVTALREVTALMAPANLQAEIDGHQDDLQFLSTFIARLAEEHNQTRKQLESSEQRYRRVVNSLKEVVFKTDWQGCWVFLNPAWEEITGFTVEESLGRSFLNFVHPADRNRHLDEFLPVIEQRTRHCRLVARYLTKSGTYRWIEVFARLVFDDDGQVLGTAGTLNDITESRLAAQALEESHKRLVDAIENLDVGILMVDADNRVRISNRALRDIYSALHVPVDPGLPLQDVIGAYYQATPELQAKITESSYVQQRLNELQLPQHAFERHVGDQHYAINHHRTSDGGTIIQHTNITGLHRHTIELASARDAAQAASRSKSDFLANMSHEIRTPMNGVLGMIRLALDTHLDTDQRELLRAAYSSAEGLLGVINEILDFSKIEAGKLDIHPELLVPDDLIYSCIKGIAHHAYEKGLAFYAWIDPQLPAQILTDPVRVRQILTNLLGNAIKFTESGEISVSLTGAIIGHETAIVLEVSDSGMGIPTDKLSTIFAAFEQADGSTTRRFGGTGLGLTICRRIVEKMQGTIQVRSTPGKGSTFRVVLPVPMTYPGTDTRFEQWSAQRVWVCEAHEGERSNLVRRLALHHIKAEGFAAVEPLCQLLTTTDTLPDLILVGPSGTHGEAARLYQCLDQAGLDARRLVILRESGDPLGKSGEFQQKSGTVLSQPLSGNELQDMLHAAFSARLACADARPADHEATLTRTGKVLLVEDNAINRKLALRLLEKLHCTQVDVAESGTQAIQMVQSNTYALILMDIQMPDMSGLEATRAIRLGRLDQQPPIVAMTARAMADDRNACFSAGMNGYLTKPIEWQELNDTLDHYVPGLAVPGDNGLQIQFTDMANSFSAEPALWHLLCTSFLEEAPKLLADYQSASQSGDAAVAERKLHAMASCSANFIPQWAASLQAYPASHTQAASSTLQSIETTAVTRDFAQLIGLVRDNLKQTGAVA